MFLLHYDLLLVRKTSITRSTNQTQNLNQLRLGNASFPTLWAVCLFSL